MVKRKKKKAKRVPHAQNVARYTEMFVYNMQGHSYPEVAKKFNTSVDSVEKIARDYDWKSGRKEYAHRAYAVAMVGLKKSAAVVLAALDRDAKMLHEDAVKQARMLTPGERSHFLSYMDRVLKEVRLEDGKPTEHTSGAMTVEVQLPPGVKHYGLVPPSKNVKYVKAEDVVTKPTMDLSIIDQSLSEKEAIPHDPIPSQPSPGPTLQPKEGPAEADATAGVPRGMAPAGPSSVQRGEGDAGRPRSPAKKRKHTSS